MESDNNNQPKEDYNQVISPDFQRQSINHSLSNSSNEEHLNNKELDGKNKKIKYQNDFENNFNNSKEENISDNEFSGDEYLEENEENDNNIDRQDHQSNVQDLINNKLEEERANFKKNIINQVKEYLFIFILLCAHLSNLSITSSIYTITAFIVLFLIKSENSFEKSRSKRLFYKAVFFYALLILVFKIAILAFFLVKGEDYEFFKNNIEALINLGIKFIEDKDNAFYYIHTFVPEFLIIIFSFICRILSSNPEKAPNFNVSHNSLNYYVFVANLFSLGITLVNFSPYSMSYSLMIHIGFACWAFDKHYGYFRIIAKISVLLISIELILTHIFNVYSFKKNPSEVIMSLGIFYWKDSLKDWKFILNYVLHTIALILYSTGLKSRTEIMSAIVEKKQLEQLKEKEQLNSVQKVMSKIIKVLYSVNFNLHLARLACLYWVYSFSSFISIPIILFMFYTFYLRKINQAVKYLSLFLIWPVLLISYNLYVVSNIDTFGDWSIIPKGKELIYSNFSMKKFDEMAVLAFFSMHLAIIIFTLFNRSMYNYFKEKDLRIKERLNRIQRISREQQNNLGERLLTEEYYNATYENKKNNAVEGFLDSDDEEIYPNTQKKSDNSSIFNILSKYLILHIDKITILIMYIVVVQAINIIHLFLMIIFLIQIISPNTIKSIVLYLIAILQVILLGEFIWDFVKIRINQVKIKETIELIITYNNDLEYKTPELLVGLIMYCFYLQYLIYNSQLYKNYESDESNIIDYFNIKLKDYPRIKYFLNASLVVFQGLWVWILIALFFVFLVIAKLYYVLFAIKLVFFFLCVYKFLVSSTRIKLYCWLLIIYCMTNTIIVYIFQFINHSIFNSINKDFNDNVSPKIHRNLDVFGLEIYDDIFIGLLPHYASNLLSFLILSEINRITEIYYKAKELNKNSNLTATMSYSNSMIELKENSPLRNQDNTNNSINNSDNDDDKEIEIVDNNNDNKNKKIEYDQIMEEVKLIEEEVKPKKYIKYKDNKKRKISYFNLYIFNIIIFLTKSYYMLIFFLNSLLLLYYQLSVAMLNYIIIFCISFMILFYQLMVNSTQGKHNLFQLSTMIRVKLIEIPKGIAILSKFRKRTLKFLLLNGIAVTILAYLYGCFYLIQNLNTNEAVVSKKDEKTIASLAYVLGFYHAPLLESLFHSVWGHIVMIVLIILDNYFHILEEILQEKVKIINQDIIHNEWIDTEDNQSLKSEKKLSEKSNPIDNILEESHDIHDTVNTDKLKKTQIWNDNEYLIKLVKEFKSSPVLVKFLKVFRSSNYDDNNIKSFKIKKTNNALIFTKGLKTVFEEVIVFLLFITLLTKLNATSYLYLVLILIQSIWTKSPKIIFCISSVQMTIILLQIIMFISNISSVSDPANYRNNNAPDWEFLYSDLKDSLNIPWYDDHIKPEWGFFLSFGVKYYEIKVLITDFIIIILSYYYFEYFSYSDYNRPSDFVIKSAFRRYICKKSFISTINLYHDREYNHIKESISYNFDIEIPSLNEVRTLIKEESPLNKNENAPNMDKKVSTTSNINSNTMNIYLKNFFKGTSTESVTESEKSKKDKDKKDKIKAPKKKSDSFIKSTKKVIYMSLHNVVLVLILIIALNDSGIINATYIIFSMYFLYNSKLLLLGEKYSYPRMIKSFLMIYLFVDIFIQVIYQNPINAHIIESKYKDTINIIIRSVGINLVVDYEKFSLTNDDMIKSENLSFIALKALTYFLISIQSVIFASKDFKEFYILRVLKFRRIQHKYSLLYSFVYNNKRIQGMNKVIHNREELNNTLFNLEKQLDEFDNKFLNEEKKLTKSYLNRSITHREGRSLSFRENKKPRFILMIKQKAKEEGGEERMKNMKLIKSNIAITGYELKNKIKEQLLSGILTQMYIKLYSYTASYIYIPKSMRKEYRREVIKGNVSDKSTFEQNIEEYVDGINLQEYDIEELIKVLKNNEEASEILNKSNTVRTRDLDSNGEVKSIAKLKEEHEDDFVIKGENDKDKDYVKKDSKNKIEESKNSSSDVYRSNTKEFKFIDNKLAETEELSELDGIDLNLYSKILNHSVFKKDLKSSNLIYLLCLYFMKYLLENSQIFVYIVMFMYPFFDGKIISLVWPFLLFGFGLIENPRPKKTFWNILLILSFVIISVKFLAQFKLLEDFVDSPGLNWFGIIRFKNSSDRLAYFIWDVILLFFIFNEQLNLVSKGLWKHTEDEIETLNEAIHRVYSLKNLCDKSIDIAFERFVNMKDLQLKRKKINNLMKKFSFGKDTNRECFAEQVSIVKDNSRGDNINNVNRTTKFANALYNNIINPKKETRNIDKSKLNVSSNNMKLNTTNVPDNNPFNNTTSEIHSIVPSTAAKSKNNYKKEINNINPSFFERTFPKIRNLKPGKDFYWSYLLPLLLVAVYLIVFYSQLEPNQELNVNNNSTNIKQFSGTMVLLIFFIAAIMVIDRSIYIRQNRNNIELEYYFFDKTSGKQLSIEEVERIEEENNVDSKLDSDYKLNKMGNTYETNVYNSGIYETIYLQKEETNVPLLAKYFMLLFVLVFTHILIFVYLPFSGNYNINSRYLCEDSDDQCNYYSTNNYLKGLYFFFGLYFIFSSLQISYGLLDMRKQALLMRGDNVFYSSAFKAYKAIPFLYELKLTLEWALSPTSLDLFKWIKFEQVYDLLFITHCTMKANNKKKVGSAVTLIEKSTLGCCSFFILIVILLGPLLLFSNLNPVSEYNNTISAKMNFYLCFNENQRFSNFSLFKNEYVQDISEMNIEEFHKDNYDKAGVTRSYPLDQVQIVSMFPTSDSIWDLTPPKVSFIIEKLKKENYLKNTHDIFFSFRYEFTRPLIENDLTSEKHIDITLYDRNKKDKSNIELLDKFYSNLQNCDDKEMLFEKFLLRVSINNIIKLNINPCIHY